MQEQDGKLLYQIGLDLAQLKKDAAETRGILEGISNKAVGEGKRIDSTFSSVGKAITGAFTAASAAAFIKKVVDIRGEVESLEVSFRTLLGSESAAAKMISEIRTYAVSTPMQMNDIAKGAQTMLAFNIASEKVMPTLKAIGDISMGDAQKFQSLTLAFSQMSATGKLMGQDLLQMINAGFNPLAELSVKTGKSISELKDEMSKGAVSAEMISDAFMSATAEGGKFYGMLEQQSKGINGSISNLQGALYDMFNAIGENLQQPITNALNSTTELVKNYEEMGKTIAGMIGVYGVYKTSVAACAIVQTAAKQAALGYTLAQRLEFSALVATEKAQKLLNATMLSNPFVAMATAVAALAVVYYKLYSRQTESQKAQERVNSAMEDFNKQQANEQAEASRLFSKLKEAKKGTEEYEKAKVAILNKYGEYLNGMSKEVQTLQDLKGAYDAVSKAIKESAMARAMDNATTAAGDVYAERTAKARESLLKLMRDKFGDKKSNTGTLIADDMYNQIVNAVETGTQLREEFVAQFNQEKWGIKANPLTEIMMEFAGAQRVYNEEMDKAEKLFGKRQENAAAETEETTNETKQLSDAEKSRLEQMRKAADRRTAERIAAEREYANKVSANTIKIEQDLTQAAIDAEDEGLAKELAQNKLNYEKRKTEIAAMENDMVETLRKVREKQYKEEHPAATETELENYLGSITSADLTDEQINLLQRLYAAAGLAYTNANKNALETAKNDVLTYTEQRAKIEKDAAAKIASFYDGDTLRDGFSLGNVAEVERQRDDALESLDRTIAEKRDTYKSFVNKISEMSYSQLKSVLQNTKTLLENAKNNGASDEYIAELMTRIRDLETEIASLDAAPGDKAAREWSSLNDTLENTADAFANIGSAIGGTTGQIITAVGEIASATKNIMSGVSEFATLSAKAAELAAEGASTAINRVEQASVILSIIGEAAKLLSSLNDTATNIINSGYTKKEKALNNEVDELKKSYTKLGDAVANAFGDSKVALIEQQRENIKKQIDDLTAAKAEALSQKGLTENERDEIRDDYDDLISDLRDDLESLATDISEVLFGQSIADSVNDLADAIVGMWEDGSDAAKGFADASKTWVKSAMQNMLKDYLSTQQYVEKIQEKIRQAKENDGQITRDEWESIVAYSELLGAKAAEDVAWMEEIYKNIGYERDAATATLGSVSQESVNEQNGRLTAIQGHTYAINETTRIMSANISSLLASVLRMESDVTAIRSALGDMQRTNTAINRNITTMSNNGLKIR